MNEESLSCPFLPRSKYARSAVSIREVGNDRGPAFYQLALECAEALVRRGLPAQAILMLNRAFTAELVGDETVLKTWAPPYRALLWILENRGPYHFIGNPRRHFQHLATRLRGSGKEARIWRAWACWKIVRLAYPEAPADEKQFVEEGVVEPEDDQILAGLTAHGWPGEAELWRELVNELEARTAVAS